MIEDVSSPGCLTAIPSAIVSPWGSSPASGAHAAACTPIRRSSGRSSRRAIAIPAASPPPPTGITTVPAPSGSCSASSSPSVPCPAITRGSSNGVHERRARSLLEDPRRVDRVVEVLADQLDGGAVAAGGVDLGHRRSVGHEDRRGDPGLPRRPRDGLTVVAGTRRDDAGSSLRFGERRDDVDGAADLERPRALQVLGLEVHRAIADPRKGVGRVHGRDARDPVQPLTGGEQISESGSVHHRRRRRLGTRARGSPRPLSADRALAPGRRRAVGGARDPSPRPPRCAPSHALTPTA